MGSQKLLWNEDLDLFTLEVETLLPGVTAPEMGLQGRKQGRGQGSAGGLGNSRSQDKAGCPSLQRKDTRLAGNSPSPEL